MVPSSVSELDYLILNVVLYYWQQYGYGPAIGDIAREAHLSRSTATKHIQRLVEQEFLRWLLYLDGRRVPRSLQLTKKGILALQEDFRESEVQRLLRKYGSL